MNAAERRVSRPKGTEKDATSTIQCASEIPNSSRLMSCVGITRSIQVRAIEAAQCWNLCQRFQRR
jgi:hypothetical protein